MASEQQVKRYLACWFQLGKKLVTRNGRSTRLPKSIIAGDRYSQEFESIWQEALSPESGDCYLEGTSETIAELLTPRWDIESCVRCDMPVALINLGSSTGDCACSDLSNWPNKDLPAPREPVSSQQHLGGLRDRLQQADKLRELEEKRPTSSAP